jgi:hypothetical protein
MDRLYVALTGGSVRFEIHGYALALDMAGRVPNLWVPEQKHALGLDVIMGFRPTGLAVTLAELEIASLPHLA